MVMLAMLRVFVLFIIVIAVLPSLAFPLLLPVVIMACNSVITARAILNYDVT